MKKFKKWYCIASVVFATVVLVLTLSMCTTQTAYATSAGSSTKTTSEKKSVPDAAEDVNNGFSIAYNNDGGSLSAPIKILLFLTVIDSDHADLVYEDHRSASFFKECDWYADISTEPGSDRTCTVFDIVYHVTGVYADQ